MTSNPKDNERMAWSLGELGRIHGISAFTLRAEVEQGNLKATRIRRRLLVTRGAWEEYLASHRYQPEQDEAQRKRA